MAKRSQAGSAEQMRLDMGDGQPEQAVVRLAPDIESIDDLIADLQKRLSQLSELLDKRFAGRGDASDLAKLFALYAQTASRLGRLLRDRRALSGAAADGLATAVGQILDELGSEWGVPL